MANAIITVIGEVRNDRRSTFTDPHSGEVRDKRVLEVLTRGGFLNVTVPKTKTLPDFVGGEQVVFEVEVLPWNFNGKTGTSFIYDETATLGGVQAPLASAGN